MTGRHQQTIYSILIFWVVIAMNMCEKLPWGSPCKNNSECSDGKLRFPFSFSFKPSVHPFGHDIGSKCEDSRCKCARNQFLEFEDNNYVCIESSSSDILLKHTCKVDDPDTCVNGVCTDKAIKRRCECNDGFVYANHKCRETVAVDYSASCRTPYSGPIPVCNYDMLMRCNTTGKCGCFKDHFYDVENKNCISKEAYVEKYSEETKAGLDEFCGISSDGLPKVCDKTANMTCVSNKCKCAKEFYPSFSISFGENNTCESKASYVKENNLTSYKVIPGLYCYSIDDCITGLTCASNECACPHPCTYDTMTIACDCGAVSSIESSTSAIVVGVVGGIAIIVFWGYVIKKHIDKKTINNKYYDAPKSTEQHTPVPLSQTTTNDYSTLAPAPNPPYPISPVSNSEPSPVHPYPASAPSDPSAPVGFAAPVAPPSDVTQNPPPYTSNPSPYPTSPAPYTSNPIPYQTSPATDPGNSISPAINTEPGYPISPDAGQTTDNSTNPIDNATPYALNPPSAPAVDIYKPIIF